ncbi:tumor necrosis factor receptor superfamily member 10A-like isoform X4 [Choloepus didactylus]|uniref:tumor necrosis factor receptor superfamily member 10A-like isoform X4 n=1 Tax=Choloepus didactylus TaxID=27675 RepID=UPI00189E3C57|nr:tumor necrosis factor receptor superfamily member 10A-like isoform X4 [Choloepus didactylus]
MLTSGELRSPATRGRQGALPSIMAQHSALDASGTRVGARAGSAAGPRTAAGASPRLRGSGSALWCPVNLFVAICVLLPVLTDSAPTMQQFRGHRHVAAAQRSMRTPLMGLCPPGSHVSDAGGNCTLCRSGVEYTSHWNALFSCLRCSVCKSDEEEMSPCTRTRDAQCRCKPGTFRGEDALEFCQKCKTGCPKGMVEAHPCTPWGDVECVHQGSGCGEDSKCLARGRVKAQGSQRKRMVLVPANDAEPTEKF